MSYLAMHRSGAGVLDDHHPLVAPAAAGRAIRVSTAVAVLTVAGIAAYVSYWHAYAVVCAYGENGLSARLEPAMIDGLVYASSMVNLYAARYLLPVPRPGPLGARPRHRRCTPIPQPVTRISRICVPLPRSGQQPEGRPAPPWPPGADPPIRCNGALSLVKSRAVRREHHLHKAWPARICARLASGFGWVSASEGWGVNRSWTMNQRGSPSSTPARGTTACARSTPASVTGRPPRTWSPRRSPGPGHAGRR